MANITVEVATSMDLGAEARAGRRVGAQLDLSMFFTEGMDLRPGHGRGGMDDDDNAQDGLRLGHMSVA